MDLHAGALRHTDELRAAGYTPAELHRMCRSGVLSRLRRGAYLVGPCPAEPEQRHAILVRAAVDRLAVDVVVSHISAAVLLGLPVWGVPLGRVSVTRDRRHGARTTDRLRLHAAPMRPDEITVVDGIAVTGLARTVVDVARTVPFEQAVVVADGALATGLVGPDELTEALVRAVGWQGVPDARRVVAFADGGGKSAGESRSRVAIARAGLPVPLLQWRVATGPTRRVREVDFAWPELRTVGEFDRRAKYGRLLKPGQDVGEVVYQEKLREDEVRAEDLAMVRWGWADLSRFGTVADRLRSRFRPL